MAHAFILQLDFQALALLSIYHGGNPGARHLDIAWFGLIPVGMAHYIGNASSTARVMERHSGGVKPNTSVRRSTAARTTESKCGSLANTRSNRSPRFSTRPAPDLRVTAHTHRLYLASRPRKTCRTK